MSLFNALSQNDMMSLVNQFMQFKQTFTGNPQQQVQQLLRSGKISQAQYDQAVQKANALQQMLRMVK